MDALFWMPSVLYIQAILEAALFEPGPWLDGWWNMGGVRLGFTMDFMVI